MAYEAVTDGAGSALQAPVRNRYFYGKLLDVHHLTMEQRYLNDKRWLLNRLGFGVGVLCGLEVVANDEGTKLAILPGVAIVPSGKEVVVAEPYCIEEPRQPTDDAGRPDGDPVDRGLVSVRLCYHECETEPAPVLVADCDVREECRPSAVRERYKLLIRSEPRPIGVPSLIRPAACRKIFPASPPATFNRRVTACSTLSRPCPDPAGDCVVLATVALEQGAPIKQSDIDQCGPRRVVYSNATLFELILCLADRVADATRVRILRYVSGDAQTVAPNAVVSVEAEVVDGQGQAVQGETVTLRVLGGAGSVNPQSADTAQNGKVGAQWTVGAAPGLNTLEASIASGSAFVFHAVAQ